MRFLFVDRILELIPGERITGIKHVTRDDPYLYQDDKGSWCFPPSLIGESLGQLAAWNVMSVKEFRQRPVAGMVASAQLHRPVFLNETILLKSFIERLDEQAVQYHSVASVGSEEVFSVQGALGPLLPMEQFIKEGEVRRQFAEINRLCPEWSPSLAEGELLEEPESSPDFSPSGALVHMRFDRTFGFEPGVSLSAEKRITRSAPYFPDHFPYNPVLPMTILLECQLNLARDFLKKTGLSPQDYQITEFQKIKMNDFVKPGDVLYCEMKVFKENTEAMILRNRCEVGGKRVCVADIVVKKLASFSL